MFFIVYTVQRAYNLSYTDKSIFTIKAPVLIVQLVLEMFYSSSVLVAICKAQKRRKEGPKAESEDLDEPMVTQKIITSSAEDFVVAEQKRLLEIS